jgi:hypothetical protein
MPIDAVAFSDQHYPDDNDQKVDLGFELLWLFGSFRRIGLFTRQSGNSS